MRIKEILANKIAKESAMLFIAQIMNVVFTGLALIILRPNFLSPADIGLISYANSFVVTLAHFFNFGLDNSGCRLILYENDEEMKKKIAGMTFFIAIMLSILFSIVVYLLTFVIPYFGNDEVVPLINIVLPFVSYVILHFFAVNICYSLGKIRTASVLTVLYSATYLPLMIVMQYIGKYNIQSAMFTEYFLQFAVALGAIIVMAQKYIRLDRKLIKPIYEENKAVGIKVFVARMIFLPTFDVDKLILGAFYSMETVGYYSLGRMIAAPTIFLGQSIGQTMYRRYADEDEINTKVIKITFASVAAISIAVFIVGIFVITFILGESYKPILSIFPIAIISAMINGYMQIFTKFMDAKGMASETRKIAIVGVVLSAVLYFSMIIPFGMYGAIIARAIVLAVILFMRINYSKKYKENKIN